jgi:hypothetical protein
VNGANEVSQVVCKCGGVQGEKQDKHFSLSNHEILNPDARACSGGATGSLGSLPGRDIPSIWHFHIDMLHVFLSKTCGSL